MVKLLNEPFGDLRRPDIDVGLYGHIHLRAGGLEVSRQARKVPYRLTNDVKSRDRDRQRPFVLRLRHDLIDAGLQVRISATQTFLRRQQGHCRTSPRRFLLNLIGRAKLDTILPVPTDTRPGQLIVARDMRRRLAGGKAAIDLGTLEMVTCVATAHAPNQDRDP